jgi:hypothetical protein
VIVLLPALAIQLSFAELEIVFLSTPKLQVLEALPLLHRFKPLSHPVLGPRKLGCLPDGYILDVFS